MKRYSILYALACFVLSVSVFGDVTYYLNESFESPVSGGYQYLHKANGSGNGSSSTFGSSTWSYVPGSYVDGDQGYGVASNTFTPAPLDGSQVLYVQRAGTMSTTISGLTAGQTYNIGYIYTVRPGNNPSFSTAIDGTPLITQTNFNDIPADNLYRSSFKYHSGSFTATGETATFSLTGYSTGDQTVSLDLIRVSDSGVKPVDPLKYTNNWVAKKWTSDADSGVVAGGQYTHAYNFGTTSAVTLNGIEFAGASRTSNASSYQKASGNLSFLAFGANNNGGWSADAVPQDAASASIAKETAYNFQNIVLNGLEPGATYETTIYLRKFGGADPRSGTFTINGNTSPVTNAGALFGATQGSSGTVSLTGTADDEGVIYVQVQNNNPDTFHLSGVSNRYVSSTAGYNDNVYLRESFTGTNDAKLETLNTETGANAYITGTKWTPRSGYTTFPITNSDNVAKLGANVGMGLTADMTGAYKVRLSADIKTGNLMMSGSNIPECARGVGLGFFDSTIGTTASEVGCGFSGIVVMPNGTLLYYDNQSNKYLNATTSQVAYSGVTYYGDSWTNLALDLEIIDGGYKAKVLGVQLDGSTADYSSLIGKVFNTTDLVGFSGSSSSGNTFGYLDNLQLRVLETSTPEIRTQQLNDYRTEFLSEIASRNHQAFTATSFTGATNAVPTGETMDLVDRSSVPMVWKMRGWNDKGLNPHFEQNQLVMTNNMGVMSDIDLAEVLDCQQGLVLSVDVAPCSLSTEVTAARISGLGVGFFSDEIGTTFNSGYDFIDRGFNGIIIRPDGSLQFFENITNTGAGSSEDKTTPNFGTTPIAYGGTFDSYAMETLMMTLEPNGKGGLTLVDLSFGDSTADYSSLLGRELSMTDMVGFLARSANSWDYVGLIDNFGIETYAPEPSTWALLLLGVLGLGLWRRKRSR